MLIKTMHLDKFSDYALRILIALSVSKDGRGSATSIALNYGLSRHHIAKVASELVRGGYVTSERGRGGGLRLARPASEISVGAVLRTIMDDVPVAECFGSTPNCTILPACGLRGPLSQAKEAFFTVLDGYSLRDISQNRAALVELLGAP
jgi:Rrf2 family nitric oxide-sensitive transcriptional repressor